MPCVPLESDRGSSALPIGPSMTTWPTEIRLPKDRKALAVSFDTGEQFVLPAEYLRVKSPSVEILEVQPVGNYAVRLTFDDMHSTGIYSWDYLHELGSNQPRYWQEYLDELAARGMSREPAGRQA